MARRVLHMFIVFCGFYTRVVLCHLARLRAGLGDVQGKFCSVLVLCTLELLLNKYIYFGRVTTPLYYSHVYFANKSCSHFHFSPNSLDYLRNVLFLKIWYFPLHVCQSVFFLSSSFRL